MAANNTSLPPVSDAPEEGTGKVKERVLTATEKKQWGDTMSMMVWTAPGFQHILYKLLNAQNGGGEHVAVMATDVPYAATDGKNVIVNPDTFFKEFSLPERVYVLGHEIIHNVFGDVELLHRCSVSGKVPMNDGTSKPFHNHIMQRAMDVRINALLNESKIGRAPKEGHFDKEITSANSVLDIYGKYYEDEAPDESGKGQGPGGNPGGFDTLQKPGASTGQNPQQAAAQRNPQQWAVEIAAAQTIEQARSQGKMAASLKRMFKQLLEPEVPWIDHIETLINRVCGDGGYDWTTPDPWMAVHEFFSPSPTGHGAGWIVIWGDTSGSRSDQELASNMAELGGIMEAVNPQRLTVLWCDADIDYIDELTDPMDLAKVQARGAGGGGGTSYQPVLDWIKKNGEGDPDLFIGFTDGYVTFPKREHAFPTIWASSTDHVYPFGQVVRVNKIARSA